MNLKYRKSRLNYTLLEILAAMGVFMIIALVVMRFFNGAQKLTTSTNSYNEMYADVRAFFDILGNDLQTMVYNNSVGIKGNQPFLLSYYDISSSGDSPFRDFYDKNVKNFYDEDMIPSQLKNEMAWSEVSYVPLLCFIANPNNMPTSAEADSPTCEVRYTFIPVGATPTIPNKYAKFTYRKLGDATPGTDEVSFKHGGKILRSLTYDDGTDLSGVPENDIRDKKRYPLDYKNFPIVDDAGVQVVETEGPVFERIKAVFGDKSSYKYEEVIGHVYRMNITCYKLEVVSGVYSYKKYKFVKMDGSSPQLSFNGDTANYITWPPASPKIFYPDGTTEIEFKQLGHPLPDMVRVDLYVLSPQDWSRLMNYYDWKNEKFTDEVAAKRLLRQKMRSFSRVFHINIKDSAKYIGGV